MKFSKFTHAIQGPGGVFVYHSANGEKCKITKENYDSILELLDSRDEEKIKEYLSWLIEKGMIVEDDEDGREEKEYYVAPTQEIKELAQRGLYITNLRLNVTQNCNLRCKYCFENALENYENRQKMDFETAKKAVDVFLDLLEKNGKSEGNIRFFGGEPLLDFSLITRVVEHVKQNKNENITIHFMVNSNGTLITDEMASYFAENDIHMIISLDGLEEINDINRVDIKGSGSFRRVEAGLKKLLKYKCSIDLATVVTEANVNALLDIVGYIKKLNDEYSAQCSLALSYLHITSENGASGYVEKTGKIIEAIKKARASGINCFGGFTHQVFHNMISPNGGRHCMCLGTELSVMPDGKVFPCYGIQIELGSIDEIDKLLKSDNYFSLIQRTCGFEKKCRGCEIEYYCAGGCYADFMSDKGKEKNTCRDKAFQVLLFRELVREYLLS